MVYSRIFLTISWYRRSMTISKTLRFDDAVGLTRRSLIVTVSKNSPGFPVIAGWWDTVFSCYLETQELKRVRTNAQKD